MYSTSAAPTRDRSTEDFSLLNVLHSDPTSITLGERKRRRRREEEKGGRRREEKGRRKERGKGKENGRVGDLFINCSTCKQFKVSLQ